MARFILVEEIHLSIYVPHGLPAAEDQAIRATLIDTRFHAELRRAIRKVVRHHPALRVVRVKLSR
jgi:hypothetical protein